VSEFGDIVKTYLKVIFNQRKYERYFFNVHFNIIPLHIHT